MSSPARILLGRVGAVILLALATGVASAHGPALELDRSALLAGEWWRLWTGHLVHGSPDHLRFDLVATVLLGLVFGRLWRLALCAPFMSLALLLLMPGLECYYGLSGLLHGWLVFEALSMAREQGGWLAFLARGFAVGTLLKAALETALGISLFSANMEMGGAVIHASHLIGAVLGLALFSAKPLLTSERLPWCGRSSCGHPR